MKASRLVIAGAVAALAPFTLTFAQDPSPAPQDSAPTQSQAPANSSQGATFESLDANSDGRISKDEAAVNAGVSSQFSKYDKNADGFIEKEEVVSANAPPASKQP
jgi:Ca2+-binding EF-hand superfamily protein